MENKFEKIETPTFNFKWHSTVQFVKLVYATSFWETKVTKIENLLSETKAVLTTELASANRIARWHSACAYRDRAFYIIGGFCNNALQTGYRFLFGNGALCTNIVQKFDLTSNEFEDAPDLNEARNSPGSFEIDGRIYAVGGADGTTTRMLDSIEYLKVLNGATAWEIFTLHHMTSRYAPMVCPIDKRQFLIAGG